MSEVPNAGKYHGDSGAIRGVDYFLVTHRPARLDDRRDPGLDGRLDAVGEGKKASEASTDPIVGDRGSPAALPLSAAFAAAILTLSTRLIWPAPMPTGRPVAGKDDRIRFDVFHDLVGEQQVGDLGLGRRPAGHGAQRLAPDRKPVALLDQDAT